MSPVAPFVDLYSNYDKSFVDWIRTASYKDRPILCVFATPERALAQVHKHLKESAADVKVIPLPFISISRTSDLFDHSRYCKTEIRRQFWDADNQCYVAFARPQPMKVTYQISLWARLLRDINDVQAQIVRGLRANETYLSVVVPPPLDSLYALTTLDNIQDVSVLEGNDEQRLLRRVFTFNVSAWIFYDSYLVKQVEKITIPIYESDDMVTEDLKLDDVVITS